MKQWASDFAPRALIKRWTHQLHPRATSLATGPPAQTRHTIEQIESSINEPTAATTAAATAATKKTHKLLIPNNNFQLQQVQQPQQGGSGERA
jgi:hypothetical protein